MAFGGESKRNKLVDRISNLPEPVLHDILSCLSMKDVARFSILSKKWKRVTSSLPIFHFDFHDYLEERGLPKLVRADWGKGDLTCLEKGRVKEFMNFIDRYILRFCKQQNLAMCKFWLFTYLTGDQTLNGLIDSWLKRALEKGVTELVLITFSSALVERDKPVFYYVIPEDIFVGQNKKFCSLRKLHLYGIDLNEKLIDDLTLTSPFLTHLFIGRCRGLKSLKVSRLLHLEKIYLVGPPPELQQIDIDAPSLQFFKFFNISHEIHPRFFNFVACQNLTHVVLIGLEITNDFLCLLISRFPLEILEVSNIKLERISISAPRLKVLKISYCYNLLEAYIDAPSLLSFWYADSCFKELPTLFSENALCNWKFYFSLSDYHPIHTFWFPKFREFLGKSRQTKDLEIKVSELKEVTFDLEELEEISLPPLHEIEYLRLDMVPSLFNSSRVSYENFTTVLDGLLWTCRPKNVLVKWDTNSNNEDVKELVEEKLMNRGDLNCCSKNSVKCWKHFLKDSKFVSFREVEDKRNFRSKKSLYDLPTTSSVREIQFTLEWHSEIDLVSREMAEEWDLLSNICCITYV